MPELEGVMNLLRNGLLMRKTGDRQRTELTEEFASQCGFSAEFITRSSAQHSASPHEEVASPHRAFSGVHRGYFLYFPRVPNLTTFGDVLSKTVVFDTGKEPVLREPIAASKGFSETSFLRTAVLSFS